MNIWHYQELARSKSKCKLDDDPKKDDVSRHYIKPFIKKQEFSQTDEISDDQEKWKDISLPNNYIRTMKRKG